MKLSLEMKWFLVAIFVFAVASVVAVVPKNLTENSSHSGTQPYFVTIDGTVTCLTHKGNGPHTMECAFGLQTIDGSFYALKNIPQDQIIEGAFTTGKNIQVSGMLIDDADASSYAIKGTIDIETITKQHDTGNTITLHEGEKEDPLTITHIYGDYVEGLNAIEYPVAREDGAPITLHIGDSASNGCTVTLTLVSIEGNAAVFSKKEDQSKPCPICLPEGTLIDTPKGAIAVENIQTGMSVWSVDGDGNKVEVKVLKTSKTPVPATHQIIKISLGDGRIVSASPRHPTTDGRMFADLEVGAMLDGSEIIKVETELYTKGFTYDLLPSGSGFYFANGVLIGSTLKK